jgi:hypothetical protein
MAGYVFVASAALDLTNFNTGLAAGQTWTSATITPPSGGPFYFDLTIVLGSFTPNAAQVLQIFKLPETRASPQLFADATPSKLIGQMTFVSGAGVKSDYFENQWCPKGLFRIAILNVTGGATLPTSNNAITLNYYTEA